MSESGSGGVGALTGGRAMRGAVTTGTGQVVFLLVQLTGLAVLSRLVAPADIGVVAMALAVVGIAEVFRDFGLTQAVVRAPKITDQQRSNLFWINSALGILLAMVLFSISGSISELYDDARLVSVTQFLSLIFFFNGVGAQFRADLNRRLRFKAMVLVNLSGALVGLLVAVAWAVFGGGYWAVASQPVVAALVSLVVAALAADWMPSFFRRGAGTLSFLRFGWYLALAQILDYLSKNVGSVLIGARLGAVEVGYFNRAFQMSIAPLSQVQAPATRVALPVLSRLLAQPRRLKSFLLAGQTALLYVVIGALFMAALAADYLVPLFLGPGWDAVIVPFRILAVSAAFQAATYASYWVFLYTGNSKALLKWSLISRPLVIVSIVIGSAWGLEGVAWAYMFANAFRWPAQLLWVKRTCNAPAKELFANGARAILTLGSAALITYVIGFSLPPDLASVVHILIRAVFMLVVLAITIFTVPAVRVDAISLLHMLRLLRKSTSKDG